MAADPHEVEQGLGAHVPLGSILVRRGVLSEEQLAFALAEQQRTGEKLGAVLVRLGYTVGPTVGLGLASQHGGPLKTEYGYAAAGSAERRDGSTPAPPSLPAPAAVPPLAVPPSQPKPQPASSSRQQQRQLERLEADMAETEAALERSRLRCVELQRRVGELQAAAGGAESATAAARVTELEAELAEARARIGQLEAASADASAPARFSELESELAQTRTRVAQLELVREQLEAGTAQHGRELAQARKQTVQLEAELAQSRARIGQLEAAKLETAPTGVRDPGAPLFRFEAHAADSSHLLFAPVANGYLLFEQDGPPPKPETLLTFVDGNGVTSRFRVAEVGAPPLPGITLACAYLVEAD